MTGSMLARQRVGLIRALAVGSLASICVFVPGASAQATTSSPGWAISSIAQPTSFSSADDESCEEFGPCDSYAVTVTNVGTASSSGTIAIKDTLPSGLTVHNVTGRDLKRGQGEELEASVRVTCTTTPVQCEYPEPIPPGDSLRITIRVTVSGAVGPSVLNRAEVQGGGAASASTGAPGTLPNTVNGGTTSFGVQDFSMSAYARDGGLDSQAGDHPDSITTNFGLTSDLIKAGGNEEQSYIPVEDPKTLTVALPIGLIGNPLALPQCSEAQLEGSLSGHGCPANTRVGTIVINTQGAATYSGQVERQETVSDIYNISPEAGYPAEFGFRFVSADVLMFARVMPTAAGQRVLLTAPSIPHANGNGFKVDGVTLTFFGNPAEHNGGTEGSAAFLTNPTSCQGGGALSARIEATSWVNPQVTVAKEVPVYPQLTGCERLQFAPTLMLAPETTQADAPSGYQIDLAIPQSPNLAPNLATPELKDATVVLPPGVSVSPGSADGLLGCKERGPEGIELGDNNTLSADVQEGEELGADGLPHATPGHCPPASEIGDVEVETPILPPHTLSGHLYLAQPQCGGENQPSCTEASATNGELFGLYLEVAGQIDGRSDGVIVKQRGSVSADPVTGQLTATFNEDPQLPFSELRIHLNGGPRAPLANPQNCGLFQATSELTPWSAPATPDATPSSTPFAITGCINPMPFAPSFSAGTITPNASASSAFTLTVSRGDGEQDLSRISTTLPPGLIGMLSELSPCDAVLAAAGRCPESSRIGSTTVAAGAGSHPIWIAGRVYLTGPYNGAPFGLAVVVPATAGPFNLGDVVVRAAINIDPATTAVTVTSGPLPQIKDGVPFRLRTVNVVIDRPGFMINPTNCLQHPVTGTIAAAQGAAAEVSSPFAVANCATLPFKPKLTALTEGKTSKARGAYLHVKVVSGAGQANIGKVKVDLPRQLPSRLTTLQKACPTTVFQANPAACPTASLVGEATAVTPVLGKPLEGPAYLVSYGGAAFPDLVVVLQGEGITINLVGNINIKNGVTSSTFNSVPDAPISTFDLVLPSGPHSVLAANIPAKAKSSFCKQKLAMPTSITAQNGAVIKQSTKIAVAGCPRAKKAKQGRKASEPGKVGKR
jgi:hypothetical protein